MRKNVGGYERIVRLLLGAALTYLAVSRLRDRRRRRLAAATGVELLASAGIQRCPANAAIGRNTYRGSERRGRERSGRAMGDLPA